MGKRQTNHLGMLLCWLLLGVLSATGQGAKPGKPKPANEPAPAQNLLKIPVWVEAPDGNLWQEGKRQSFKVFLDEQEAPVKSFQGPRNSTVLLVVFDTVADMARVEQARMTLDALLKDLPENYWVGLLRAQDGLAVLQEPTANRAQLLEKTQDIQINGKAGLLDTLEPLAETATRIQQKAGVRLSVLYITDSGVANYRADLLNPVINSSDSGDLSRRFSDRAVQERMSRLAETLNAFTIPFFILHLEHRADTLNLAYQSGLEKIAVDSGGLALFCRTNDEIASALGTLFNRLRAAYVVGVEAPRRKRPSVKLRVEALDATGQPMPRVQHANQLTLPKD